MESKIKYQQRDKADFATTTNPIRVPGRCCAIMQPTYFPWAGYFNLMASVETFVFLDDVQYSHRSWQQRNRILIQGKPHWITVPVKAPHHQEINQTEVVFGDWRRNQCRLLTEAYRKHPHGRDVTELADLILDTEQFKYLGDLNIHLIRWAAGRLKLSPRIVRASELSVGGHRTDHLIGLCERLEADSYLSAPGSRDYLVEDGFMRKTDIRLFFHDYIPRPYPQYGSKEFVSHLSIIDVVANLGWDGAISYILHKDVPGAV